MGSGNLVLAAQKKYGVENFKKEILAIFDTEDQMFDKEIFLISKLDPHYNIHPGGKGGFNLTPLQEEKRKFLCRQSIDSISEENKKKLYRKAINTKKERNLTSDYFRGKRHTDSTKQKMRNTHKEKQNHKKEKNSQYGTMWITDGVFSKKIKRGEAIPEGFVSGRKCK